MKPPEMPDFFCADIFFKKIKIKFSDEMEILIFLHSIPSMELQVSRKAFRFKASLPNTTKIELETQNRRHASSHNQKYPNQLETSWHTRESFSQVLALQYSGSVSEVFIFSLVVQKTLNSLKRKKKHCESQGMSLNTGKACCRLCLAPEHECVNIFKTQAADKQPIQSKINSCVSK
ncbi:CLUMA_CG004902, isoform A [Clunio marinus]|uniref:CLUMA_CG004902, isoform A n=1 Tax=Clunio marinus TaxID=568069 RepID=A0A1J1HT95_9DIPT|nr:CLUMA_CG004902, isoform A [Clunio marinus]